MHRQKQSAVCFLGKMELVARNDRTAYTFTAASDEYTLSQGHHVQQPGRFEILKIWGCGSSQLTLSLRAPLSSLQVQKATATVAQFIRVTKTKR